MEKREPIRYSEGVVWFDHELGITRVEVSPGVYQTLSHAKEQMAAIRKLNGGVRHPLLVNLRNVKGTDREARAYFGSEDCRSTWNAAALVTGTPISNAIANVLLGLYYRREDPVKLFTSEAEAIAWLKGFVA